MDVIDNLMVLENNTECSKSISYKIIDSIEDFDFIKTFWIDNQWHHYTDFDYYKNIVSSEKGVIKPYIIVACQNGSPISLVICNICEKYFKLKFGYKSLLNIKTHYLEIMYGGILGDQSPNVCKDIIIFIKKVLAREKLNYTLFKELDITSVMYKELKSSGNILSTSKFEIPNPHISMDIPDTFEKFMEGQTSKRRHEARRYAKRFEKEFGDKYEIILFRDLKDIDKIMKDVLEIAAKTYQYKLGVTIIDDNETRRRFNYELQNKRLMVWIMYIESKPVAYWIVLHYKETILGSSTGYLQEYNRFRPGLYLFLEMIKYLCKIENIKKFDFGFGDAQYKREFGGYINIESNICIYSNKPKGLFLNIISIFNTTTINLYRKLSQHFELVRKIKKKSRDNLSTIN
jgi:hypothetical protein